MPNDKEHNNFDGSKMPYKENYEFNGINPNETYSSIHLKNPESYQSKLENYTNSKLNFNERYHALPNGIDPKVEFNFTPPESNSTKFHADYAGSTYNAIGQVGGNVIYDVLTNGNTNLNLQDMTRQVYSAGVWESINAGSVYGAAYYMGKKAVLPAKVVFGVLDYNHILKREMDYLMENKIFTKANISKAKFNATLIASVGAFSAEIKFASSVAKSLGLTSISAASSFTSRAIKDSYDHKPHKMGWSESFFVFKTKYLEYPLVFVIGSVNEGIDSSIEWSADKLEDTFNWMTQSKAEPKVADVPNLDFKASEKSAFTAVESNATSLETASSSEPKCSDEKESSNVQAPNTEDILSSTVDVDNTSPISDTALIQPSAPPLETIDDQDEYSVDLSDGNLNDQFMDDPAIVCSEETMTCRPDYGPQQCFPSENSNICPINGSLLDQPSGPKSLGDKIYSVISGEDVETCRILVNNINSTNSVLEGANFAKNFKNMKNSDKLRNTIGFALRNFQSSTLSNHELGIIKSYGNLLMKDKITPQDFAVLLASFPDTPFPVVEFLNFGFAALEGNSRAVVSAYINFSLSILALSNPFFMVGKVLLTTVTLIKQLFTTTKVIDLKGIQAVYTHKVRVKGFFKKFHKCSLDNDFFGIHAYASGKGHSETKNRAKQIFESQAKYKVYQVIGSPHEILDPNFKAPEGRLNTMLWGHYLKTMFVQWLETNKKHMTNKEYKDLKKKFLTSEDQIKFNKYLSDHGYTNSWFSNHSNENPIQFYHSVCEELAGCNNLTDGFKKFLGLFVCDKIPKAEVKPLDIIVRRKVEDSARSPRKVEDLARSPRKKIEDSAPIRKAKRLPPIKKLRKFVKGIFRKNRKNKNKDNRVYEKFKETILEAANDKEQNNNDKEQQKFFERLRDSRSDEDNSLLDYYNDNTRRKYYNQLDEFSRYGFLRVVNEEMFERHISVGYILDNYVQTLCSTTGCTIAYADKELKMLYYRPKAYICYKSEQLASGFTLNYLSNSITEHLMTLPTILADDTVVTDEMLRYFAPASNVGISVGLSSIYGLARGKPITNVMTDSFYTGVNSSITTGIMTLSKETALMKALDLISKDFATNILVSYGIVMPEYIVSSIVISTAVSLFQRTAGYVSDVIDETLTYVDPVKKDFYHKSTQLKPDDIFRDLKENDPFFTEYNDPFDNSNSQSFNGFGMNNIMQRPLVA